VAARRASDRLPGRNDRLTGDRAQAGHRRSRLGRSPGQRREARDALFGRRIPAQQRRLRQPMARQQDPFPKASLVTLELYECGGEACGIAGQPRGIEIGIELAGA
jgi:hypothetical protein